jgi:hypothetical protein
MRRYRARRARSDKISINPKNRRDHIIVRRSAGVDYWEGER